MLPSTHPSSVRTRFNPRIEALEDRSLMAVTASFSEGVLTFTGTSAAETLTLNDDSDGSVTVSSSGAAGSGSGSFSDVEKVVINLAGGNDVVTYNLTGTVTTVRHLDITLGAGNDSFTANLGGRDLRDDLYLNIRGGDGNDRIQMYQIGCVFGDTILKALVTGNAGSDKVYATMVDDVRGWVDFDVRGNSQGDLFYLNALSDVHVKSGGVLNIRSQNVPLDFDYLGELDGKILLYASGSSDSDSMSADLVLDSDSTGSIGDNDQSATIAGKAGSDKLRFQIVNNSDDAQVFAKMNGGGGEDVGTHTRNVTTTGIERDEVA